MQCNDKGEHGGGHIPDIDHHALKIAECPRKNRVLDECMNDQESAQGLDKTFMYVSPHLRKEQFTCREKIEQPEVTLDTICAWRQRNAIVRKVKSPQFFVYQVDQDRERCNEGEGAANEEGLERSAPKAKG